jgi:1-acyl-sn-glycerol-3-phosphate acyltransferase
MHTFQTKKLENKMKSLLIGLVNLFLSLISNLEISGIENLPDDRSAVIAANHIGYFDAFFLLTIKKVIHDKNLVVIVAEKYQNYAFYRWAVKVLGFIFIDRFNSDVGTLKTVIRRMNNDGLLVIAPEGTRSPNGQLIEAQQGAVYIAAKTGAVIIPLAITGCTDKMINDNLWKKRLDIKIEFGKPYPIPEIPRKNREEFLRQQTDELMCRIAAILPPAYRGYYAENPGVKQLLKE